MSIRKCRTPGCEHRTREGLRGSHAFRDADGEYCWRCRRAQGAGDQRPAGTAAFFLGERHEPPTAPLTEAEIEADLTAAWGPENVARAAEFRRQADPGQCSDVEFERIRAGDARQP